ncbi:MAG: O-antigen ligase family protein [Acidobacteria bacterium]|nr:MAG: O-antigen ligase family protein [Acidobacteriota bacterium]
MFKSPLVDTIARIPTAFWLVPLVPLAVLVGVRVPPGPYLLLLALVAVAVVAALVLLTQVVGRGRSTALVLLMFTSVILPVHIDTGTASRLTAPMLLVALLTCGWIAQMVIWRKIPSSAPRPVWVLLLFMAACVLSFVVGQYPWFPVARAPLPAQLGGLALFILSGCAFLLFAYLLPNVRQLRRLTWVFILTGAVMAVIRVVPSLDSSLALHTRPGTIGSMFWTWLTALSFGQALINRQLSRIVRAALLILTCFLLCVALVQYRAWVSGWIPPLIAIGVIAGLRYPRLFIVFGLVALPLVMVHQGSLAETLWSTERYSADTRMAAWIAIFEMLKTSPLLGFGPANYYCYTHLFPVLGWYVTFNSHNNYIDLLAQTGVVGLLLFLWFAWAIGRMAWRMRARVPQGFPYAYVVSAIGGLVATLIAGMLGDWVIPFVYNVSIAGFRSSVLPWLFLGGLVALDRLTKESLSREDAMRNEGTKGPQRPHGPQGQSVSLIVPEVPSSLV